MNPAWTTGVAALAAGSAAVLALLAARAIANTWLQAFRRVAEQDLLDLFIFIEPRRLLWLAGAGVLLVGATGLLCGAGPTLLLPLCGAVGFVPGRLVALLRQRRLRHLQSRLPDMLALWAGLLRSGRGVMPALSEVAGQESGPMGQELRLVLRRCRVGGSLDSAVGELAVRVADPDLALLATTLRLANELGGNLAEALQRLSATIRDRLLMESRIVAMTAQGRLQGVILGLLPLLLLGVLLAMEPQLIRLLRDQPVGWAAVGAIGVLELLGYLSIRRVVRIRV
jgi:tight adherence protein B